VESARQNREHTGQPGLLPDESSHPEFPAGKLRIRRARAAPAWPVVGSLAQIRYHCAPRRTAAAYAPSIAGRKNRRCLKNLPLM